MEKEGKENAYRMISRPRVLAGMSDPKSPTLTSIIVRAPDVKIPFWFSKEVEAEKLEHQLRINSEEWVKMLLKYLKRYGVPEKYLFEMEDLIEMKNMPKVTRCMAMLAKMVTIFDNYKSFTDIFKESEHFSFWDLQAFYV